MSSIIEATVVDGSGREHGSFGVEFPDIANDTLLSSRYVVEPFTDQTFKVTLTVEHVGESV